MTTFVHTHGSTIQLEGYIVPANENLGVLLLNGERFSPQSFKSPATGLVEEIRSMFGYLKEKDVQDFKVHMTLQSGVVTDLEDLAKVSTFLFRTSHSWHTERFLRLKEFAQVKKTIGLIVYMHVEHFKNINNDKVCCTLCTQAHDIPFAFNAFKPCLNPQCVSHKAEHAINPLYKIPEKQEK